jgi:type II secretory pathway component PulK
MALLATLWLIAALSAVAGAALAMARFEGGASRNRIALTHGRWAAEACLASLQSLMTRDSTLKGVDSTDLGEGTWCRAIVEDPDARLSLDKATPEMLDALWHRHSLTAAFLDWTDADDTPRDQGAEGEWYRRAGRQTPRNGAIADIDELYQIAGFDSAVVEGVRPFVTVRGSGRIDLNAAPREVLALVPGFEAATVDIVMLRRAAGRPPRDLDDLMGGLPPSLRAPIIARYSEVQGVLTFAPARLLVHLEGHVPEADIVARPTVLAIPAPGRLAFVAREEW